MTQASKTDTTPAQAERIYMLWDRFLKEGDMAGLACIYAEHATLQSPLVPTFYGPDTHLVCVATRSCVSLMRQYAGALTIRFIGTATDISGTVGLSSGNIQRSSMAAFKSIWQSAWT